MSGRGTRRSERQQQRAAAQQQQAAAPNAGAPQPQPAAMDPAQFQQLMQQQQQLLAAIINQQGGQGAFTLRPYGNVLDVTKKRDNDLYADAIKPFTEKFDGSPEKLSAFIDK